MVKEVLTSGRCIHTVSRVTSAGPRFFELRSIVVSVTVNVYVFGPPFFHLPLISWVSPVESTVSEVNEAPALINRATSAIPFDEMPQ
eukprot:COSAG05_NODE_1886_length_3888_cov_2.615994_2_plen_86_part_01